MRKLRFAYLILLLGAQLGIAAEELETIKVESDKEVSPYFFGTSQILTEDELQSQPVPLLGTALEKSPGVITVQNGGIGGRTSFFIRGTESRHVAFTLDNLKLNDPSNTDRQFDAAFLGLASIREVRLHQGPQAVIFGSDAMGGHLEMISRKGEAAPESRLSLNAGSFGTLGSSLSTDWRKGKNQGTLSVLRLRTDGLSRLNKKRFNAKERDGSTITHLTSSSTHQFTPKLSTDLLASYLNGFNELDGNILDNGHDRSSNDQYLLQQKTSFKADKALSFSLRNGLNRHQRFLKTLSAGKDSFSGNLIQNEAVAKVQYQRVSLLSGISHEHEAASFADFEPDFDLYSLFTQGIFRAEGFAWQGGLRAEEHTRYGRFLTGATGLQFFWEKLIFSLQYSRGFKAPSLYQLYATPIFGTPIGNKDLVPESNQAYEAKLEQKSAKVDWAVTLFQNRLSNLITFSNAGYRNQGRFTSQGLEASLNFKQQDYQLLLTGTHQDFRNEESVVLRRPNNYAQAAFSWFTNDSQEIFTKLKWFDARRDFDQNLKVVKLNSFETVDVGIRQGWGRQDVSLQVLNILNRSYEEFYGFSVTPRAIFTSYNLKF